MAEVEKLERYRTILRQVVQQHAQLGSNTEQPESIPICDSDTDNYLLLDVGWDATGRVHYVVFHLRLIDGKVWIEADGIEYGIAQDLLAAGIPQEDIVMAARSTQPKPLPEWMAA